LRFQKTPAVSVNVLQHLIANASKSVWIAFARLSGWNARQGNINITISTSSAVAKTLILTPLHRDTGKSHIANDTKSNKIDNNKCFLCVSGLPKACQRPLHRLKHLHLSKQFTFQPKTHKLVIVKKTIVKFCQFITYKSLIPCPYLTCIIMYL
jgi:hypothetical protein